MDTMVLKLEQAFTRCSDGLLHPEYEALLRQLYTCSLNRELVDFLCDKAISKKHFCEIRFEHLKILLLNPTAHSFDLKNYFFTHLQRCRRLWLKLFYIRGYALYATEAELQPVMQKFCASLKRCHDYIDYEPILSVAGLPYLKDTYGYPCIAETLDVAIAEYKKIDPLLRGYFTLNKRLEQIALLSREEVMKRGNAFLNKIRSSQNS